MKQNPGFTLQEIAGVPYLLPFGQMIVDHKRGLKTNATGVYLWNLLIEEHSLEEVLSVSAAHYNIPQENLPAFREEITYFLRQLLSYGILTDTMLPEQYAAPTAQYLSIGGLYIKFSGPAEAFPPHFSDFALPEVPLLHQTIYFHVGAPRLSKNGQVLLRNHELMILEQEHTYLLLFPNSKHILELQLSKTADIVHCYCLPPYDEEFHCDLFHALRLAYLYLAAHHDLVALHSSSILYQNKLWLFSGHSGMGKSTHTNLWKELLDTPIINGDLNLLSITDGQPVVHGIPWCGTSGIYDTKTYPLGGIILLNQAKENVIEELSADQKLLLLSQRLISPTWTQKQLETNLNLIEKLIASIAVCKLHCTKEKEVLEVIKPWVDSKV